MGHVSELRNLIGSRPIILVGANVIVVDSENRILLQLRTDNNCWGLPGGSMDFGESLEDVAKRELYEETNLIANELLFFNVYSGKELYYRYPHGDKVYNVVATFVCRCFQGELKCDENEGVKLNFFHCKDLPENLSNPDKPMIRDFVRKLNTEIPIQGGGGWK
ncbi:NUDIX hydrolase [Sporosarcina sp. Marseille-Q4943]|uniref:NUDIX hydrolase n=1 Tax=Sporosarcina sp. Marseille-Q4943 TaxID=2942204 RepID=UPI00208DAA0C|nr:NUDIX hydrolase [Sporosarcina sp. Marseille-Q4943]